MFFKRPARELLVYACSRMQTLSWSGDKFLFSISSTQERYSLPLVLKNTMARRSETLALEWVFWIVLVSWVSKNCKKRKSLSSMNDPCSCLASVLDHTACIQQADVIKLIKTSNIYVAVAWKQWFVWDVMKALLTYIGAFDLQNVVKIANELSRTPKRR